MYVWNYVFNAAGNYVWNSGIVRVPAALVGPVEALTRFTCGPC
jgi:hypothetical protein